MSKKHNQCGDPTISAATRIAELERTLAQRDRAINDLEKFLEIEELEVKALTDENNHLRSMIRDGELNYAKLMGYVERIHDEQPPVMVPAPRESFITRAPDGSQGFQFNRTMSAFMDRYGTSPKPWFERG